MITVSSFPPLAGENPYLRLYYGALAADGIGLGPDLTPGPVAIRALAGRADAIHIQWQPEVLWRRLGSQSRLGRLTAVFRFWKTLRLAQRLGLKVVWTLHDIENHEWGGRADRLGLRVLARAADLCICHDQWAADQFVARFGGRPERVIVMPHGNYDGVYPAPAPKHQTLQKLALNPLRRTLLCIGNIRKYKGFEVAVQAMRELGPDYQLIVAGMPFDDTIQQELRDFAEGGDSIRFVFARLSDTDFADCVAASDAVLLPYRKITGSGALVATATLGRGTVTSDLPYFRGFLADEPDAGIVATEPGPAGFARAIREFFTVSPDVRGAAARRIADRYPWSEVVRPVADWFRATFPDRQPVPQPAGGRP